MARRGDRSLAALLLAQRLEPVGAAPLKAAEYWPVVEACPELEVLLDAGADEIAARTGVEGTLAGRMRALLDGATTFAFRLDQLEQAGLRVVASVDGEYPAGLLALGRGAPPLLYGYGDFGLLSPTGGGAAGGAADGAVVVGPSGPRADGDPGWAALQLAVDGGGAAVGVLAGGLARAVRDPEVRRHIVGGRLCLCSPFPPDAPETEASTEARARVLAALK